MLKKSFKWPKEIIIFWIIDFLLGLELIGPVLLIFFKDWGGLNQAEIQTLQSWFTLCIFLLEIPTGVFGDLHGKKKSVLWGYALTAVGTVVYTLAPNIYLFALSELIFAFGVAFISGAKEALVYEVSQKLGLEEQYRHISVTSNTLHMLGMITASILFFFIGELLEPQVLFRIGSITSIISFFLLGICIQEKPIPKKEKSLKPNYLGTAKEGLRILKNASNLKRIAIYISIIGATSYFVIWLYQEALRVMSVPENMYGIYRAVLLIAEIIAMPFLAYLIEKISLRKTMTYVAIFVAVGFILAAMFHNMFGIIMVLSLSGGLGLQIPSVMSKDINGEITGEQRATVLSFMSMARRLALTIFNPFIGLLVDSKGVFFAFAVLGVISLFAIFFKSKRIVFGK